MGSIVNSKELSNYCGIGLHGEGGEWMKELGLGFTNPLGTGGVLDRLRDLTQ